MKVLTLRQPWASLVACGVKNIETRSWRAPASAIGQPLLIHAGAKTVPYPLPIEGVHGTFLLNASRKISTGMYLDGIGNVPLPLGAIVASCVLTDCVPIVDETGEHAAEVYKTIGGNGLAIQRLTGDGSRPEHVHTEWITDQLPFGDFSPGRYAWLLSDVRPTTERCPRCMGEKYVETWNHTGVPNALNPGTRSIPCPTCEGRGSCDPVPARGRQGLWEWAVSVDEEG